jgi:hypothetical protein
MLAIRNNQVFDERRRVIDYIYDQYNWRELREKYLEISYNEMVFKFWKPVESFYKDLIEN